MLTKPNQTELIRSTDEKKNCYYVPAWHLSVQYVVFVYFVSCLSVHSYDAITSLKINCFKAFSNQYYITMLPLTSLNVDKLAHHSFEVRHTLHNLKSDFIYKCNIYQLPTFWSPLVSSPLTPVSNLTSSSSTREFMMLLGGGDS